MDNRPDHETDVWSEWLLHRRHADDPSYERVVQSVVERLADHVLDDAKLSPGMTLAAIGAGEGLLAFRAIERVGSTLQTVLTDLSPPLLLPPPPFPLQHPLRAQSPF